MGQRNKPRLQCIVCGGSSWSPIPDPVIGRAITTAGLILDQSLSRGHCRKCGLGQRINVPFIGQSDFYEKSYAAYYQRAGAAKYDARRYEVMAAWMMSALGNWTPRTVLDVGCGAGWSMMSTRKIFPNAVIEGIEPSRTNSDIARSHGFLVHEVKAGQGSNFGRKYDLVYSNNVLMHVTDPVSFLANLEDCLEDGGRIVIVCPDSSQPSNELLWCDHNFSFMPDHVRRLASKVGLTVTHWAENPDDVTVLNKQIFVLAKVGVEVVVGRPGAPPLPPDQLFLMRCDYIKGWQAVNETLGRTVASYDRVLNFGSSMWTWLLAAYCPDYWARVDACLVDGFSGGCIDKEVLPFESVKLGSGDCVVLGLNPQTQAAMKARMAGVVDALTWYDLVWI